MRDWSQLYKVSDFRGMGTFSHIAGPSRRACRPAGGGIHQCGVHIEQAAASGTYKYSVAAQVRIAATVTGHFGQTRKSVTVRLEYPPRN